MPHGSPKDAQAQLRHSKLEMTGWYMREIPESVRSAVAEMDAEICHPLRRAPLRPALVGHNEFPKAVAIWWGDRVYDHNCY